MKTEDSASGRFALLSAKAVEFERLARERTKAGQKTEAEHYQQCARRARDEASGFDSRAAMKEFCQTRARVSVALNQDALDVIERLGMPEEKRARFLSRLVQEALFAIDKAGVSPSAPGAVALSARAVKSLDDQCWCERFRAHVAAASAVEFELARADVAAAASTAA